MELTWNHTTRPEIDLKARARLGEASAKHILSSSPSCWHISLSLDPISLRTWIPSCSERFKLHQERYQGFHVTVSSAKTSIWDQIRNRAELRFWIYCRTRFTYHIRNVLTNRGQTVSIIKKWARICINVQIVSVGSVAMRIASMCPTRIPQNMILQRSLPDEMMTLVVQYLT